MTLVISADAIRDYIIMQGFAQDYEIGGVGVFDETKDGIRVLGFEDASSSASGGSHTMSAEKQMDAKIRLVERFGADYLQRMCYMHSHPGFAPSPSGTDTSNIVSFLEDENEQNFIVTLIFGSTGDGLKVSARKDVYDPNAEHPKAYVAPPPKKKKFGRKKWGYGGWATTKSRSIASFEAITRKDITTKTLDVTIEWGDLESQYERLVYLLKTTPVTYKGSSGTSDYSYYDYSGYSHYDYSDYALEAPSPTKRGVSLEFIEHDQIGSAMRPLVDKGELDQDLLDQFDRMLGKSGKEQKELLETILYQSYAQTWTPEHAMLQRLLEGVVYAGL